MTYAAVDITSKHFPHNLNISIYIFFFWPCHRGCRILVPQPGIEPGPLAVRAPSPNYWTAREFPVSVYYRKLKEITNTHRPLSIIQDKGCHFTIECNSMLVGVVSKANTRAVCFEFLTLKMVYHFFHIWNKR